MSLISPSPALKKGFDAPVTPGVAMTLQGVLNNSAALLAVLLVAAGVASAVLPNWAAFVSSIAGLVVAILTVRRPELAVKTALPYAVLQGVTVGLISRIYAQSYGGGIVVYAVGITLCIFAVLLAVYRSGLISVTQNFRLGVAAATGGIAVYYIIALGLQLFGVQMPLVASSSWMGIGFSVLVIVIASANLVIDFDFIEQGVAQGAPKHMEWYAAFGLLVTLVWLYLEVLRLVAKLQSRD
jgi:uncharacterized YccA/Bax inhibitor family protein